MKYNYDRQERLFLRPESVLLFGRNVHVSIDTSYKENEFELKVKEIVDLLESNKKAIDDAFLNNIYEVFYDTWMYEEERNVTPDEFFQNIIPESLTVTKNTSCTLHYTTGPLFEGKTIELMYDGDGNVFVTPIN